VSTEDPKGTVLILAWAFPPYITGAARPFRFYKYLPRFGYTVQVLTASKQDPNDVQTNVTCVEGRIRGSKFALEHVAERLQKVIVAAESLMWALRTTAAADQIISREKVCAVVSTSPPVASHLVALKLKTRYGVRWIADFRDPLVGNPFRKDTGIAGHLDRLLQKWIFRRADAVVATTDATVELWRRQHPEHEKKMHLIWNGFDPEDRLEPVSLPQRAYKLLVHVGAIYGIRDPGALLCSFDRLIKRGLLSPEKLRIQLIGPVEGDWCRDREPLADLVRLGCLRYDGVQVPKREAARAMASADAVILLDSHGEHGAIQVPAKLFDYIRIGRPILAVTTRNSPADRLLARSGVPYSSIYPEDTPEEVDQRVLCFLSLPPHPVVASEWFWNEFDAYPQVRELAGLIAGSH
jgi:glycosyltransferase involved in cell wall biosynthesis